MDILIVNYSGAYVVAVGLELYSMAFDLNHEYRYRPTCNAKTVLMCLVYMFC